MQVQAKDVHDLSQPDSAQLAVNAGPSLDSHTSAEAINAADTANETDSAPTAALAKTIAATDSAALATQASDSSSSPDSSSGLAPTSVLSSGLTSGSGSASSSGPTSTPVAPPEADAISSSSSNLSSASAQAQEADSAMVLDATSGQGSTSTSTLDTSSALDANSAQALGASSAKTSVHDTEAVQSAESALDAATTLVDLADLADVKQAESATPSLNSSKSKSAESKVALPSQSHHQTQDKVRRLAQAQGLAQDQVQSQGLDKDNAQDKSRPHPYVFKHFAPKHHESPAIDDSHASSNSGESLSQTKNSYTKSDNKLDAHNAGIGTHARTNVSGEKGLADKTAKAAPSAHSAGSEVETETGINAKTATNAKAQASDTVSAMDAGKTVVAGEEGSSSVSGGSGAAGGNASKASHAGNSDYGAAGDGAKTADDFSKTVEAVYDGAKQAIDNPANRPQRKHVFLRSLQFRIIWIVTLAGLVSMTIMSVLSHNKITKSTHDFVDEELSQIASVAINYRMIIPRRWEAPRHYHDRVMRLMQTPDGSIIMQLSVDRNSQQLRELAQTPAQWFDEQERLANAQAAAQGSTQANAAAQGSSQANAAGDGANRAYGRGQGGPGRGLGPGQGRGMGPGQGRGMNDPHNLSNWANQTSTPSLSDLSNLNYDIMIAPLYGRPGDALYIPLGVSDGFYTVMVADERVRAFVATNANGQRFVVARPLSSLLELMRQSFYASFLQFFLIDLIAIPLIIILSINFMLRSLNRLAQDLYHRSDEDLSPVLTNDGRQNGFIPSELDGFIISINRLFQRVDESMQSKRRFIADAAHEMRTQSTVLSLQIAALDNEELPPSAQVKLKRLKEGIAREKSLMTSLLTLAREQGCVDLSLERINIFELYTKLIEEQGLVADNKNIDLGVDGEVNFNIVSDRSKLTRIMSNLLSNAIKYTPHDGRIDLKAQANADGSLTLTVQDDGPGIPPEHLKHILEPFYRVDGDRSAVQGTGLGLAIVKASCDSLKAQLRFANATPHGLIASITLKDMPAPENDMKAQAHKDKEAQEPQDQGAKEAKGTKGA